MVMTNSDETKLLWTIAMTRLIQWEPPSWMAMTTAHEMPLSWIMEMMMPIAMATILNNVEVWLSWRYG